MNSYPLSATFNLPKSPHPIVIIGAGGIMEEAHLPAYRKAGWDVQGIYDIRHDKATRLAGIFEIPQVHSSIEELIRHAPPEVIFDIAVPASRMISILELLPHGAGVMMQKPMGETLEAAATILRICESKEFIASVNFQMTLIPSIIAANKDRKSDVQGKSVSVRLDIG